VWFAVLRLGGRIRQRRRARGLSLTFVAAEVHISRQHLAAVERGERPPPRPSHPAYGRLAELLGEKPERLRGAARRERLPMIEGVPWRLQPKCCK
jgi:transcriptional regulator with XRE-family HTH domain